MHAPAMTRKIGMFLTALALIVTGAVVFAPPPGTETIAVTVSVTSGPTPSILAAGDSAHPAVAKLRISINDPKMQAEADAANAGYNWTYSVLYKATAGGTYESSSAAVDVSSASSAEPTLTASFSQPGYYKVLLYASVLFSNGSNIYVGYGDTSVELTVMNFRGKVVPEDNFANRSLLKLGVGETGTLDVELAAGTTLADLKPLTWAKTAGTGLTLKNINTDAGTAELTAADTDSDATISLTDKNGNKITMTVSVIKPTGAYQVKGAEGKVDGMCGAYMCNYTYLLPSDVSFWKTTINEGTCNGVGTGSQAPSNGQVHTAWNPVAVSKGDASTGCLVKGPNPAGGNGTTKEYDYVMTSQPLNIGAGTFAWNIPWQYSVGTVTKSTFTYLLHYEEFFGNKTVKISKGGASTTQTGP